jgi:hypothetical protein
MISITRLTDTDIPEVAAAFATLGWNKPASQYWELSGSTNKK